MAMQPENKIKSNSKDLILVGVDDGYAMTKIALPDGRMLKIPSRARAGVHGSVFGAPSQGLDGGYETEGQTYSFMDAQDGEGTRFDGYQFSPLNRVIVHHALRVAGLGGKAVKIATGLPVGEYFSGPSRTPNLNLIDRKIKNMKVPVKTLSGEPCSEIGANFVFAEGVAAWIDYALNDKGDVIANIGALAAVVDIGGRTTDCVTVLPGFKVDDRRSGTANIGVLDLYEAVARHACAKFNVPSVPMSEIENSIKTGFITLWGKPHDVKEIVAGSKKTLCEEIQREVSRRIGGAHEFEKVLFVGGGAVVFDGLQDSYPNAVMPKNPEFANARGLLKYMRFVA
jgi:plasmid segregation protein ParM